MHYGLCQNLVMRPYMYSILTSRTSGEGLHRLPFGVTPVPNCEGTAGDIAIGNNTRVIQGVPLDFTGVVLGAVIITGRTELRHHAPLIPGNGHNRPADSILVHVRPINALIPAGRTRSTRNTNCK